MTARQLYVRIAVPALAALLTAACGGGGTSDAAPPPGATAVELPGAAGQIDFDDIVYSPGLGKVVVPARDSGLYLIDPDGATATRLLEGSFASADGGRGLLFLGDRSGRRIDVVDLAAGKVVSTVTRGRSRTTCATSRRPASCG